MDGGPGGVVSGVEAREGNQLTRVGEGAQVAALSQELTDSQVAQARNGAQQVSLLLEGRMLVEMVRDSVLGGSNLLFQKGQLRLQMVADRAALTGQGQSVTDAASGCRQILQMAHQ